MSTKHTASNPCSEASLLNNINDINRTMALINKEPCLSDKQKMNMLCWKIGEILFNTKMGHPDNLKKLIPNLDDHNLKLPQLSLPILLFSYQFYEIYHKHSYPIHKVSTLKKAYSLKNYIKQFFRCIFNTPETLTLQELVIQYPKETIESVPIFLIPWERNMIILENYQRAEKYHKWYDIDNKLWYAQSALLYLNDETDEHKVLKIWIQHNLAKRSEDAEDTTEKDYCPNAKLFSYFCADCKRLRTRDSDRKESFTSMLRVVLFLLCCILLMFIWNIIKTHVTFVWI